MGTKRLKQSKYEKEIRINCQQLQQKYNRIELERATFERENQKLLDEINKLKCLPEQNSDEDIFLLREECIRFQEDLKTAHTMLIKRKISFSINSILVSNLFGKCQHICRYLFINIELLLFTIEMKF
ncbi:unnamed protein product [Rotaria sp. Silwood1]|nr:unnamed protein product [Rotaria sp. Silwood1]CAF5150674.1 unnamed protein product [Rotaria sp. Silwood1]